MTASTVDDAGAETRRFFPAYGPLEALLGTLLFFAILETVTPAIVEAAGVRLPDLSAETVGFGLALFAWFVVGLTLVDQVRRQLAALDIGSHPMVPRTERAVPSGSRVVLFVALLGVGGLIATATYEIALRTVVSVVELVAYQDVAVFGVIRFVLMVVFFVSYGIATWAFDRLVIGGVRAVLYN